MHVFISAKSLMPALSVLSLFFNIVAFDINHLLILAKKVDITCNEKYFFKQQAILFERTNI